METETKTLTMRESQQGAHTVVQRGACEHVVLSREALQTLVQYAYDTHGIMASPSYDTEAAAALTFTNGDVVTNTVHGWTLTRRSADEWVLSNGHAAWNDHDVRAALTDPRDPYNAEVVLTPKATGCPCGLEGCSDRPAYVAEYRAGLQVGAL